jgi:RNA polymerase sigma-70 factor (ECF subfamily)
VTEDTDEALVARYQRGDVAAFEVLLDRHRHGVFRFLCRFVGDAARADDLTQDCWLRFVRAAPRWKEGGRFKTWLYTVARNLATDAARRATHRDHPAVDLAPAQGRRSVDGEAAPAGAPEGDVLLRSALQRAIAALPDEQREVFLLREYEGVTFAEIAEVTGAPVPTVKSRMRYALEALRRGLQEAPGGAGHPAATRRERA